jgi:lysophospholipase L1-like esterase
MGYMRDASGRRLDTFEVQPLRKPTIVLFGDSRTDDCDVANGDPTDTANNTTLNLYSTNMSWFDWGQCALAGGPVFDVIRNAGVGGNTTTQMLARFQTDVVARQPSHMTLWGGTNDGWTTTADVDATYARMVNMLGQARAAGIYVFLISETTSSTKGTSFPPFVQYYNELLRGYAASNLGVEFWDFNSLFVNPAATTGYPLASMTRDGVHLSAYGASTLGQQVVAKKLARFSTSLTSLPNSLIDTMGNNTAVRNVLSNPLMQGAGGTLGSGDTGTLPDGWSSSGAPTAACSVPARGDGYGNNLRAAITATASGGKFFNLAVTPARLTPGKQYVLEAGIGITAPTNLVTLSVIAQFIVGGTVYSRGFGLNEQSPAAGDGVAALASGVIRSRIFTAPTGVTYTSASLVLTARFSGAGSATVDLGRVALKAVS